ncbi:MAG: tetratricopeptide repeat protein, partial [Gammaproteobacteria bacterium]|nr:tetratricopeptide repeat protein [Gammaproteobacteria bacterium]
LDFGDKTRRWNPQVASFFGVFLILPALLVLVLLLAGSRFFFAGYYLRNFTPIERLLTECRVIFDYLYWTCLPNLGQLGLYHDDFTVSRGLLNPPTTLISVLGLAALMGFALWIRRRWKWLSFAVLWFLAGQLIESSIIPLELVFEHRNYLPIFGVILGISAQAYIGLASTGKRRLAIGIAAFAGVMLASLTALRASSWHSPVAFAVSEIVHHPQSERARYELGILYVAMAMDGDTDSAPQAERAMLVARALDPDGLAEDVALAIMYTQLGQPGRARGYFEDAATRARHIRISATTQVTLASLVKHPDLVKQYPLATVRAIFSNALADPTVQSNACYAGNIWNIYGILLQQAGDTGEAIEATRKALSLCPSDVQIRLNYADILLQTGNTGAATRQLALVANANWFGKYTLKLERLRQILRERG